MGLSKYFLMRELRVLSRQSQPIPRRQRACHDVSSQWQPRFLPPGVCSQDGNQAETFQCPDSTGRVESPWSRCCFTADPCLSNPSAGRPCPLLDVHWAHVVESWEKDSGTQELISPPGGHRGRGGEGGRHKEGRKDSVPHPFMCDLS